MNKVLFRGRCVGGPRAGEMVETDFHTWKTLVHQHFRPYPSWMKDFGPDGVTPELFTYRYVTFNFGSDGIVNFWAPYDKTDREVFELLLEEYGRTDRSHLTIWPAPVAPVASSDPVLGAILRKVWATIEALPDNPGQIETLKALAEAYRTKTEKDEP